MEIDKVWLTDTEIWIRTVDGVEARDLLADYPRLLFATVRNMMSLLFSVVMRISLSK